MGDLTMKDFLDYIPSPLAALPLAPELEQHIQRIIRVYKCSRERALEIAYASSVEVDKARVQRMRLNEALIDKLQAQSSPKPSHSFWRYIFPKGE